MTRTAWFATALLCVPSGSAIAQPPAPVPPPATAMPTAPARIVLADVVDPKLREQVLKIARQPNLSAHGTTGEIPCDPAVYAWLVEHPDRVALAWKRLKVPCVSIAELGNSRFAWSDGDGSEVTWQVAGRFPTGVVWYATGRVRPSPIMPSIPVKAVVVLQQGKPAGADAKGVRPVVHAYIQTDSRAASMIMRMLGPTAPKLADQGAEQLLFFFDGIASYLKAHPDQGETLLAPVRK